MATPQGEGHDGGSEPRPRRQSIVPTYDSRETGPRYHVTTWVGRRPDLIAMQHGYRAEFEDSGTEDWRHLKLARLDMIDGVNP